MNWAIAIYPPLCVMFSAFLFFYSIPAFLINGIIAGFSLLGLFKKQSWAFLVAAILHGAEVVLLTAGINFFAAVLAVIGFFAFKQSRQNKGAISDEKD